MLAATSSSSPTRRCSRRGVPSICYGLRGLAYFQIDLRGTTQRPALGHRSAARSPIPAIVLAQMLAQMKDAAAASRSPASTTTVRAGRRGARGVQALPFNEKQYREDVRRAEAVRRDRLHDARAHVGAADVRGERPAARLHGRRREDGAAGRGDGQGQLRLVPDQTPDEIATLMAAHVRAVAPERA